LEGRKITYNGDRVSRKNSRFRTGSEPDGRDQIEAMIPSPRIATLIEEDCTIHEFGSDDADLASFAQIEPLICGYLIFLDDNSVKGLLDLIEGLENSELSESKLHVIESATELTLSNCISRSKEESGSISILIHKLDLLGFTFLASIFRLMYSERIRHIRFALESGMN
jgi:hypothetical protein